MNQARNKFDSVDPHSSDPRSSDQHSSDPRSSDPSSSEHLSSSYSTVACSTSHSRNDGTRQKSDIPNHIQEYRRIFEANRKLQQTREQTALPLSHFGDSKGLIFSDGVKTALITLEKTELFYLKDANGQRTYYRIGSDDRVDQPLRLGPNTLTNKSCTASPTLFVDNSMNLNVDGLSSENESTAKAKFDSQSGMLALQINAKVDSNQHKVNVLNFPVWDDSYSPGEAAIVCQDRSLHSEQNAADIIDHGEINNDARLGWPSRFIHYIRHCCKRT